MPPGRCGSNFKYEILQYILMIEILSISNETAITWTNVDPDLCCHMTWIGHNQLGSL